MNDATSRPTGPPLPDWSVADRPGRDALVGAHVRLEPIDVDRHGAALHGAFAEDRTGSLWTYMSYGPFGDLAAYTTWARGFATGDDPFFYTWIVGDRPLGVASLMRIVPAHGSIEIGHVALAPALQRTRAATEGFYLMMRHAFELGYRRLEWKCDALNAASRRAADRLGFIPEGVFRQHMIIKNRSRDTAWLSIVDTEWPAVRDGFESWLDDANFDADGLQRRSLADCRRG